MNGHTRQAGVLKLYLSKRSEKPYLGHNMIKFALQKQGSCLHQVIAVGA